MLAAGVILQDSFQNRIMAYHTGINLGHYLKEKHTARLIRNMFMFWLKSYLTTLYQLQRLFGVE